MADMEELGHGGELGPAEARNVVCGGSSEDAVEYLSDRPGGCAERREPADCAEPAEAPFSAPHAGRFDAKALSEAADRISQVAKTMQAADIVRLSKAADAAMIAAMPHFAKGRAAGALATQAASASADRVAKAAAEAVLSIAPKRAAAAVSDPEAPDGVVCELENERSLPVGKALAVEESEHELDGADCEVGGLHLSSDSTAPDRPFVLGDASAATALAPEVEGV